MFHSDTGSESGLTGLRKIAKRSSEGEKVVECVGFPHGAGIGGDHLLVHPTTRGYALWFGEVQGVRSEHCQSILCTYVGPGVAYLKIRSRPDDDVP